jgi:tetratricopeptide (TPR) repeat protein
MLLSPSFFAAFWPPNSEGMSSPITRRTTTRTTGRRSSTSSLKSRSVKKKTAKPKANRAVVAKSSVRKSATSARPAKKSSKALLTRNKSAKLKPLKPKSAKPVVSLKAASTLKRRTIAPAVKKTHKLLAVRAPRPIAPPPPRQPTVDESAALAAFENAHKEFSRGRFGEARNLFRALLDKYSQVSEVAARARTYLTIAESRLRVESMAPRDADSLYDRGVIELNRGEYVAAQEMFERALRREPEAAHIHYGLAATRARLGSIELALQSLQRALDLQPTLRVRAQHDQDLTPLRNEPDFDRLVFQLRA